MIKVNNYLSKKWVSDETQVKYLHTCTKRKLQTYLSCTKTKILADVVSWLGHVVCNEEDHPIYTQVCENIGFLLLGINPEQLNE
jgi:hypothetical protein